MAETHKAHPGDSKVERTAARFRQQYEDVARSVARQNGLDEDMFVEQMERESRFIPQPSRIRELEA